jgi:hypothetical protein
MPVNSTHPAYDASLTAWRRNRDAVSGQDAIKRGGDRYLPRPNAADTSAENVARYDRYLQRALWYAAPERTKQSLIGSVFSKGPEIKEIPSQIDYLDEDCDGAGLSLDQMAKQIIGEQLEVARVGVLVDYPSSADGASLEDVQRLNLRATFAAYSAETIINWDDMKVGGKRMLSLVVLAETENVPLDRFTYEAKKRFRVLTLEDGLYVQRLYDESLNQIGDDIEPRMSNKARWTRIPFVIIGAETNTPEIDQAPLTQLCNHAIAYWQTSADHRENLYMHGQLTLGISSDLSVEDWQLANPSGVTVGAPTGVFLGANGSFHTASAPESSSLSTALQDLREEMAELGAQIVTKGSNAQTAEAARIDASAESSVLSSVVGNASEGLEACLEWAAMFMGGDPVKVMYTLNNEFYSVTLTAQDRLALQGELDRGLIATSDYRRMLRKADIIDQTRTDENIDGEVEAAGPALGAL